MDEPTTIQRRFAENLRALRERKGLTQEGLADLARCSRNYVSNVECGNVNVSLVNIERFAIALGVSLRRIMPVR